MKINIPTKEGVIDKVEEEILGVVCYNKFIEEVVDKILDIFESNKTYIEERQEDEVVDELKSLLLKDEVADELKILLIEDTWDKYFDDLIEWSSYFPGFVDRALENIVENWYNIKTYYELLHIAYNNFVLAIGDIIIDEIVNA